MLGWIGVGMLTCAYLFLLFSTFQHFTFVNMLASAVLTIHAIIILDIPFIIVNGFITLVMVYKFFETLNINIKVNKNGIR